MGHITRTRLLLMIHEDMTAQRYTQLQTYLSEDHPKIPNSDWSTCERSKQWLTLAMAMTQPNWILRFFDHSLFISSILLAAVKPRLQVRCWPKLEVPYLGKLQCRTVKDKGFIPIYRESAHGCTACSTGAMTLLQRFNILDNGFPVQAQTSTFFHIHCVFHHW